MKAPTVATLYPRHGDFVSLQERLDPRGAFATSGCSPGARHLGWSGAPSRVEWRPSGPGHGAYTCLARIPVAQVLHLVHVAAE